MFLKIYIILCYQSIVLSVPNNLNNVSVAPVPRRNQNMCFSGNCVSKCCPEGTVYVRNKKGCSVSDNTFLSHKQLVHFGTSVLGYVDLKETNDILFGVACKRGKYRINHPFYLQQNGKLHIDMIDGQSLEYGPDKYCIDNFVIGDITSNKTELSALICFADPKPEKNNFGLSSTCMLISCFFIILTVAVYAWIPELRNLHGMVLMAYLVSFFIAFLFLATMQILLPKEKMTQEMCMIFSFVIYFFLLAAFFWMNVMSYDIWWTFSGKRAVSGRKSSMRARFLTYSIYAFSMPTILTTLLAALEFSIPENKSYLLPRLRSQGCFLHCQSKLIYLYTPIVILCVANLVFFTLTALKIAEIKKQTKVLNKKDKQRFTLYIKLFIVMGFNWILEVISSFYPEAEYIWRVTDACNVLIGLIIFIIFVCKKKTLRMIKQRYRHLMGLPPLSRTQTTSTSISTRTFSKDEMQMNSSNSK